MKAQGLMIGDFVTFKDCQNDEYPAICEIVGIEPDEVFAYIDGDKSACDELDVNELVGISLTPEILEGNGFMPTYGRGELVLKTSDYGIWVDFDTNSIWVSIRVELKEKPFSAKHYYEGYLQTVHELQHALRLCGIDKEIRL